MLIALGVCIGWLGVLAQVFGHVTTLMPTPLLFLLVTGSVAGSYVGLDCIGYCVLPVTFNFGSHTTLLVHLQCKQVQNISLGTLVVTLSFPDVGLAPKALAGLSFFSPGSRVG